MAAFLGSLPLSLHAGGFYTGQASGRILGQPDYGTVASGNSAAGLVNPGHVSVDPTSGKIFVSDTFNHRILRYPADAGDGGDAEVVFGQAGFFESNANRGQSDPDAGTLNFPSGIHVDGFGVLWVADSGNNRVLAFYNASSRASGDPADMIYGQSTETGKSPGSAANRFNGPVAVYSDAAYRLYVSDRQNARVLRFDATNVVVPFGPNASGVLGKPDPDTTYSSPPGRGNLVAPLGLHGDAEGRLWVVDSGANRVLRYDNAAAKGNGADADGVVGQSDFDSGNSSSDASASRFNSPSSPLPLPGGDLFVSVPSEHRVLLFRRAEALKNGGRAEVVLGQTNFTSTSTGSGPERLSSPLGMALDPQGRLWVALESTSRVVRFEPDNDPPKLAINGKRVVRTTKSAAVLKGTASDNGRVAAVEVKGRGAAKRAVGTAAWNYRAALRAGRNVFTVVAVDSAGNRSLPASATVLRQTKRR